MNLSNEKSNLASAILNANLNPEIKANLINEMVSQTVIPENAQHQIQKEPEKRTKHAPQWMLSPSLT